MANKARLELAENALDTGNRENALKYAGEVIEKAVDENSAHAQYIIGRKYFVDGAYEKSLNELMRISILYKNVANSEEWIIKSKLLIAQCNVRLGKKAEAEKALKEVIETHSRDRFGAEAKKLLEQL